jgi:hypothetical protein
VQPHAREALENWESCFAEQQDAAEAAATAAFSLLQKLRYPTGCCDIRMEWEKDGLGRGTVCISDTARGTVEFQGMPQQPVGEAIDALMGKTWFEAPDGIETAGPGTYYWCDEDHGGEWEIKVIGDGTVEMLMDDMKVPDVLAVLDTLHTALKVA